MKKLIVLLSLCVFLTSCTATEIETSRTPSEKYYSVKEIKLFKSDTEDKPSEELKEVAFLKGIWVSQFDMHPIFRDGSKQRSEADYRDKVETMTDNLLRDGFNTVFLQLRPNGDSMFESGLYPSSKYIAGVYGGSIEYDAIGIYLSIAKSKGLSVHAWINPFRLCKESELVSYGKGVLYDWYLEGLGKRIESGNDGILYLDPSYPEATELIADGAREILQKYDFDGIHIDDYFYPTEFEFDDEQEFLLSGQANLGDFRRSNIDRTVRALYNAVHEYEGKLFGASPAGNIYSLSDGWYVDIYTWLKSNGYVDYIMPQLYYGFENSTCPFEQVLSDWCNAVKNDSIRLYIGLSAAKCELGSKGIADEYAGVGKFEWRDNKDILKRSLERIISESTDGVCIFTYSSFYDPLSGKENSLTNKEREAFCSALMKVN